jgi:LysM repeat protein
MPKSGSMQSSAARVLVALGLIILANCNSFSQTLAPTPKHSPSPGVDLQTLAKKLDEQNAKIDMLSQQILKLQQSLGNQRPGVMIGEGAPSSSTSTTSTSSSSASESPAKSGNGNTHIVSRGETLTSIAHMHSISVSDLQKFNHIDNPTKLQAGQTLLIPPSPIPSPSTSEQ